MLTEGLKMDVTFIYPQSPYLMKKTPFPPLGIGYLSSLLKERDYSVELVDGLISSEEEYRKSLGNIKGDIIGISVSIVQLGELKRLCKWLNQAYPESTVIVGGPGVKCIEVKNSFTDYDADIFVVGEGEETCVNLVDALISGEQYESIPGLYYRSNGDIRYSGAPGVVQDLDSIPFPDRDLINVSEYLRIWKENVDLACTDLLSSRGCPYSCIFCDKGFFGSNIRFHSGKYVVDEMETIVKEYNAEELYFVDDLFLINKERITTICEEIHERDLHIRWGGHGRVNLIDEETIKMVYDAGCREINFGVESGSERIIKYLKKGLTFDQVERAFELCHKYDIACGAYFMVGIPGETREDIELTKKIIKKIRPSFINVSFLTPYPGTRLYEMLEDMIGDVDYSEWDDLQKSVLNYDFEVNPKVSHKEVIQWFIDEVDPSRMDFNIYFKEDDA
ncbi:MAG: B12-binding domain-containing radical SAM protein [Theionarchaea archaeon]|nr:B12-binding domain-containing radical SAM protein [Theionarchaea archaeon]